MPVSAYVRPKPDRSGGLCGGLLIGSKMKGPQGAADRFRNTCAETSRDGIQGSRREGVVSPGHARGRAVVAGQVPRRRWRREKAFSWRISRCAPEGDTPPGLLANGVDPAQRKRRDKHTARINASNTFASVARTSAARVGWKAGQAAHRPHSTRPTCRPETRPRFGGSPAKGGSPGPGTQIQDPVCQIKF
jgi:hypothetical protein